MLLVESVKSKNMKYIYQEDNTRKGLRINSVKECAIFNSIDMLFGCIVLKCTKSGYWGLQFSTSGCNQLQCEGM